MNAARLNRRLALLTLFNTISECDLTKRKHDPRMWLIREIARYRKLEWGTY